MSAPIIDFQGWPHTPAGQYLLCWEGAQLDALVADMFGYHAIQLGLPALPALSQNRIPHRWLAEQESADHLPLHVPQAEHSDPPPTPPPGPPEGKPDLVTDFAALPFPAASLDLVVLPHTLEVSADAHATLREVERVLVAQGRVVICGFNPVGLWALREARARLWTHVTGGRWPGRAYLPQAGEYLGYWRLRDWLRLLDFEVEVVRFGCYVPAVRSPKWLGRFAWMETMGPRWWPILGSAYVVVAVKRVRGVRLMGALWKNTLARAARPVQAAHSNQDAMHKEQTE